MFILSPKESNLNKIINKKFKDFDVEFLSLFKVNYCLKLTIKVIF